MWKLKVAEGNSPWLYSLNNYVGRQIWEYDAEAGTPEEREEVRKVQENFTKNRFRYKPNGDLLMRMQVSILYLVHHIVYFWIYNFPPVYIFRRGIALLRLLRSDCHEN